MLKELERAFNKLKYVDLAVDLKNPLLLEAMERAIRNPEDAWKAIHEAGDEITVAAKDLAKSQFFQHYGKEGIEHGKRVSENLADIEPFATMLKEGYHHLVQIYLKSRNGLKIVPDDLLVRLEMDEWGEEFFRAIFHDSKLNGKTPWTKNQRSELINEFKNNPELKYLEYEVRSSDDILKNQKIPKDFGPSVKVRIYREDIFKTISDGNKNIGETIKIFTL